MIFQLFEDIWRQSSTLKKKEVLKAYLQSLTEENQKEAIELISEHTIRKDKIKIKKQILISCIGQIVKKFINSNYKEYSLRVVKMKSNDASISAINNYISYFI